MNRLRQILNPNIRAARHIRRRARHLDNPVLSPGADLQPLRLRSSKNAVSLNFRYPIYSISDFRIDLGFLIGFSIGDGFVACNENGNQFVVF